MDGRDLDGRGEGRRIGLNIRGLLALGQVRAGRASVVVVQEVVDEMRGKGDEVGGKQPRGQDTQEPTEHGTHWGSMVPDFLVYVTIQSVRMFLPPAPSRRRATSGDAPGPTPRGG